MRVGEDFVVGGQRANNRLPEAAAASDSKPGVTVPQGHGKGDG